VEVEERLRRTRGKYISSHAVKHWIYVESG
jgi:hypothetical protein